MDETERERVRFHEAGHAAVALAVGRSSHGVTVRGGIHSDGCSWSVGPPMSDADRAWVSDVSNAERPWVAWPASTRAGIEGYVVTLMAGEMAELMLAPPRLGRAEPGIAERASDQAAELVIDLPAPLGAVAEVAAIRAVLDVPDDDDQTKIAKLARSAHWPDHGSAAAWLAYLAAQARRLIAAEAARIERLSEALAIRDTLTGEQVAALLRG